MFLPIDLIYQISNAGQLYWFAYQVNKDSSGKAAVLENDITVNTGVLKSDGSLADNPKNFRKWIPIGLNYNKNDVEATYNFLLTTLGKTEYSLYKGKNKIELSCINVFS